jgi:PAS domain S-box-containing protein
MGYTKEEFYSSEFDFLRLIAPESLELVRKIFQRHLKGEEVPTYEYSLITKDGTRLEVMNSTKIINYAGEPAILGVITDITERKAAEEKLRESEEMYRSLVKTSPDAVTATDLEGNIIFASPRSVELYGCKNAQELIGKNALGLIHPDDQKRALDNLYKTLNEGMIRNVDYKMFREDGSSYIGEMSAALIKDAHGKPMSFIATTRDITERKTAEEQIKDSLAEKEVLLQEIHHRVINNLQVIRSMIKLQSEFVKDEQQLEAFQEIRNRLKAMSTIHEKLYQSKDLARIDYNEYFKDLVNSLFRVYGVNVSKIKPHVEVQDVSLDLDRGISCGLIITELVANSLKHGFSVDDTGTIKLVLKRGEEQNQIKLIVSDSGSGFPDNIDYNNTDSFGLQLVITQVNQLEGTIELNREVKSGTEFIISFNLEKEEG